MQTGQFGAKCTTKRTTAPLHSSVPMCNCRPYILPACFPARFSGGFRPSQTVCTTRCTCVGLHSYQSERCSAARCVPAHRGGKNPARKDSARQISTDQRGSLFTSFPDRRFGMVPLLRWPDVLRRPGLDSAVGALGMDELLAIPFSFQCTN